MNNKSTRPNSSPNFTGSRAFVIGAAVVALLGAPKGFEIVANYIGGPEVPSLPNAKTPEGQAEIEQEVKEGKLVTVAIDENNPALSTLSDLSDTLTDGDPGILATGLQAENGGTTIVHDKDIFAVPTSPAAIELHNKQFPEDQIVIPNK